MPMQPLHQDPRTASPQLAPAAAEPPVTSTAVRNAAASPTSRQIDGQVTEIGGPAGPDPCRFGDWERRGRCIDF